LAKWENPPEDLVSQSAGKLERLVAAANLQKGKLYLSILMYSS
jgi:hypothetical protein